MSIGHFAEVLDINRKSFSCPCESLVLINPRFSREFRLHTDASKEAAISNGSALLQNLQASEPFRFWAIDYMGLLPEANRCNKHILVLPNGIHEAFAAPNQKVSTVTKILVDGVLNRFRPSVVLHSDQRANFEATLMHKVCS